MWETRIVTEEISLSTSKRTQLINITTEVENIVRRSGVKEGICIIHVPHATASIIANEDESGLKQDIVRWIETNIPWNEEWKHNTIDNNAAAHIAASIFGNARVFPIKEGRLIRGMWQEIFLLELDGPRSTRRILVTVIGQ